MSKNFKSLIAGAGTGLVNGLLGAGGGLLLVPMFAKWLKLDERRALATSVAVIAPLCLISAGLYFLRGELPLEVASPYLIGGLLGGIAGSLLFGKVPLVWLSRGLSAFMIYGGLKMLGVL
ncbi:hypothetical protein FACS18949_14030 [Clostridia bacterium]|nr:hypothetical protein FACS18949_14030 [Clostridia bacterium]